MLGICMIHVVGKGQYSQRWLANLLKVCVPGFVFISGYFGIKFRWRKVLNLYGVAFWAALIGTGLEVSFGPEALQRDGVGFAGRVFANMRTFWFLHAYVVLMMISPLLNAAIENLKLRSGGGAFVFVVFLWAWLAGIGHTKEFVFPVEGFAAESPLTLIGIYIAARWFSELGLENNLPSKVLAGMFCLCLPFAMLGVANYNSPFALTMAMALFVLFKRHVKCGPWSLVVAPSMFAVYMLHSTFAGQRFLLGAEDYLMSNRIPVYLMFVIVTAAVFVSCLAVDMARRGCLHLLDNMVDFSRRRGSK